MLRKSTEIISTSDHSFLEQELTSFVREAKREGLSKSQVIQAINGIWTNCFVHLPEENDDERTFRNLAEKHVNANYEKILEFFSEYDHSYFRQKTGNRSLIEQVPEEALKAFMIEVAVSIYKIYETDTYEKSELKKIRKMIVPYFYDFKTPMSAFDILFAGLLKYAQAKTRKVDECKEFLSSFKLVKPTDEKICRFVWLVEN